MTSDNAPDFSRQISGSDADELHGGVSGWMKATAKDFRNLGVTWARIVKHPAKALYVMEGWKRQPEVDPEPQFHLAPEG